MGSKGKNQTDRQTDNEIDGKKKRGMADSGNAYVQNLLPPESLLG